MGAFNKAYIITFSKSGRKPRFPCILFLFTVCLYVKLKLRALNIKKACRYRLPAGCICSAVLDITPHILYNCMYKMVRRRQGWYVLIPSEIFKCWKHLLNPPLRTGLSFQYSGQPSGLAFIVIWTIFYHSNMVHFNHFLGFRQKPRPQDIVVRGFSCFLYESIIGSLLKRTAVNSLLLQKICLSLHLAGALQFTL